MAALQGIVEAHPEWQGHVTALMINDGAGGAGLPGCAAKTHLPIGQDDAANAARTALGAAYNDTLVVDATGKVAAILKGLSLSTDAQPLVDAVTPLL